MTKKPDKGKGTKLSENDSKTLEALLASRDAPKPKKNKYWYRPPKYETPEEMQEVIDDYFKGLMDDEERFFLRPPTVSGLAFHLDMSTRALLDYSKKGDFLPIVSRAKAVCEAFLEEHAILGKTKNAISLLSMNFGRHEKSTLDINHKGDIVDDILAARRRAGKTILTDEVRDE